ncbi:cytochrome P450 4C1-like [Cydia pomonella]|uniref:cytochrome P450 4C1-like n=1 Tax=Cydia pomonella TaxID=82600 RepID=UPI002ADDA867|nr:cytochrome P450 4C1-like [Cydia pomonella]
MIWWVLLLPVLWFTAFRFRRRRMYELASRVPGVGELPLIGAAHKFIGSTENIMSSLKDVSSTAIEKGGTVRLWLGPILYFVSVDPVDLEMVMRTCLEKDDLHRFTRPVIGNGAIFAPVYIWKPRRKILQPAFKPKIVESFVPVFAKQSMKLARKLGEAGGREVKLRPYISSYTLDSTCESSLGVKINAQDDAVSPFLVELGRVTQVVAERIFHLWLQPEWLFRFSPQYRQQRTSCAVLHGFTDHVIKKKREELKGQQCENPKANQTIDLSDYDSKSFLELLIHFSGSEGGYSNEELREEILTLIIGSTDSSASTIGYALDLLAKYPHVQDKVHAELDIVFGDSDRLLEKEDLIRLKYLDCVIKETLRLFPPAPFLIRKVEEETTLPSGCVLPAGSGIAASVWGTQRNPKYWGPDADAFDPDRFLPERAALRHPCAFMAFSIGPRNCIGYQYAMMSIKSALSSVLRFHRVKGRVEEGNKPYIRVKIDVMMKAVNGHELTLERRTQHCAQNDL